MKAHDLVELATRNLRESVLRNSLTTLGIAVGVASLVAMLALGVGLQQLAGRRLARAGLFDVVVVFSRVEVRPRAGRTEEPAVSQRPVLDAAARQQFAKLPNVVEAYPEIRFPTEIVHQGRSHFAAIASLPPSARNDDAFDGIQGQFFSSPEAEEAIVQIELARELTGQPASLIGQEVALRYAERRPLEDPNNASAANANQGENWGFSVVRREKKVRVVGIIETEPFGGMRGFGGGRLFLPTALAEKLSPIQISDARDAIRSTTARATYQSLIVRVASPAQVQAVQDAIKKMGFGTFSLLDATRNLRRFFAVLDLFLGIFGSLALAVASLGIVNTLVMAILERRREIGIMKALGAGDGDIKRLFFVEAGTMGFAGGIAGVLLGWAIGRAINFGANIYLKRQDLPPERIWAVPWWLVAGAIGFAIVVSLISGLYPASRAAKLDPVQALRYE